MKKRFIAFFVLSLLIVFPVIVSAQITQQLLYGQTNPQVIELQTDLNKLGYDAGTPDGNYNYKTYLAVKKFQTDKGINASGNLNFVTLNALNKALALEPSVLSYGMRHERVTELQTYLYALKYLSVLPTGYYGTLTTTGVSNFQRDNGLAVTGKADSSVFSTLFKVIDSKYVPYTTYTNYTVVQGDTLWGIANKNGVTVNDLQKANNLTSTSVLSIGQTLKIPKVVVPVKPYYNKYGEYQDWFQAAQYIFPIGANATVIDYFSGKSFLIRRTTGSGHADCEPLTAQDTAIMKEIFNNTWSWEKRPIILVVNGRRIAASMAGMPHAGLDSYPANVNVDNRSDGYGYGPNYDYIKGNDMDGHFDIHFPGSLRHKDWLVDPEHQAMIGISSNR